MVADWGFEAAIQGAKGRSRSTDGALRQFHDWFDSFKTLKFLHQLRDAAIPSIPLSVGLRSLKGIAAIIDGSEGVTSQEVFDGLRLMDETESAQI